MEVAETMRQDLLVVDHLEDVVGRDLGDNKPDRNLLAAEEIDVGRRDCQEHQEPSQGEAGRVDIRESRHPFYSCVCKAHV